MASQQYPRDTRISVDRYQSVVLPAIAKWLSPPNPPPGEGAGGSVGTLASHATTHPHQIHFLK